jgi:hypothetical protein
MTGVRIAIRLWRWGRVYLVAVLLLAALAASCVRTLTNAVEPRPQHPAPGYVLSRPSIQLQWSAGNRDGEIRLQLSTDREFDALMIDEVVTRHTHALKNLEPGRTYYWRLVQGNRAGDVSWFEVSPTALRFR